MMRWKVERPERLARFLGEELGQSGKSVRRLLEARRCRVNGKIERFGSAQVSRGDVVEMALAERKEKEWEVNVLYENEHLKVVEKEAGWVCAEEQALHFYQAHLVHRLDKETTGALLLAKSAEVQEELMALFAQGSVRKEYLAWVDGIVERDEGVRESLLARCGHMRWGSRHRGRRAVTKWRVVQRQQDATLVCCMPLTGKTHQIRIHMAEMGHPILGDRHYAERFQCKRWVERYLLHASRLAFSHRDREIDIRSELPPDF